MDRRRFLLGLAGLAAGGAGAGCANNREVPETAPEVPVTKTPAEQRRSGGNAGDEPVRGVDDLTLTVPDDGGVETPTPTYSFRTATPEPFVTSGFDLQEADDGTLVVEASITNQQDVTDEATLSVTIQFEDDEYVRGTALEVAGGETASARFSFPVDYAEFMSAPDVVPAVQPGTPATPFPTGTATATPSDEAE